jgi:hypothetical protein
MIKSFSFARSALAAAVLSIGLASAAYAVQPGTTGTEKSFQNEGLRSGVLIQKTNTATATAGAATLNAAGSGVVTSEALTTAAAATYTLTLTNDMIAAGDVVLASVKYGTSTTGSPVVTQVTPAAGSVVIIVQNIAASAAVNGTLKISFVVVKQSLNGSD